MDVTPAAPVESDKVVYVCSARGLLSALYAAGGTVLWQNNATPSSFVLPSVGVSKDGVFVAGTDGVLTAFER
jgi:outer membrane protein assembly factor BamB